MSGLEVLLQLPCNIMSTDEGAKRETAKEPGSTNLGDLRDSKAAVYDFWTTRCVNCPAALDRLDALAHQRPSVRFVAVNIDDIAAAKDLVTRAASESRWLSLAQAHLAEAEKERTKEILGMKTVPFYVVVGQDGDVLRHGNAKAVPLVSAASLDSLLAGMGETENDPAVANASSRAADSSNSTPRTNPSLECEGGVCKLVRNKKPELSKKTIASAEKEDVAPSMGGAVLAPPADRTLDCAGSACKLLRKEGVDSGAPEDDTSAAPEASELPSPAVTPPGRSMECVGGVCKLVRKEKNGALGEDGVERAKTEQIQEPLGVGGVMPSLRVVMLEGGETKTLDEIRAGRPAVLDFWTTRCVRCPAALDALEAIAAQDAGVTYVSLNLDDLEGARETVARGRWPSVSHAFVGRDEGAGSLLESFKARAGLKSVPFYVVVAGDGRIDQIGGPQEVKLSRKADDTVPAGCGETVSPPMQAPEPAPKALAFTIDEDF